MLLGQIFVHYKFEVFFSYFGADGDMTNVQAPRKLSGISAVDQMLGISSHQASGRPGQGRGQALGEQGSAHGCSLSQHRAGARRGTGGKAHSLPPELT